MVVSADPNAVLDILIIQGKMVAVTVNFSYLALAVHVALPGLRDVHQWFIVIFVFISIFSHLFFRQPLSVLYFKFLDGERTFEIIKASCITMWLLSEFTSEPEARLRARERSAIAR